MMQLAAPFKFEASPQRPAAACRLDPDPADQSPLQPGQPKAKASTSPRIRPKVGSEFSSFVSVLSVESEPSTDLAGLVEYLERHEAEGLRITEVTYIINYFDFWGLIPLKHHGVILKIGESNFLALDFSRWGIMWDTFDEFPELPDKTCFMKSYKTDSDPQTLKRYCENTKPFSFYQHDCAAWARGVLRVVRVKEVPGKAGSVADRLQGQCGLF